MDRSKVHARCDNQGLPLGFTLTGGEASDYGSADDLMALPVPKPKALLADKGYDPVYGARPLKRVIQRELQDKLANQLLAGTIADGSKVEVKGWDGGLNITSKVAKTKVA